MSSLSSGGLPTLAGQITSTLLPNVKKIETHEDSSTISIIVAISIVFILAPVTISSNTLILAAFYRYKRLRTASNCLLASLAVSDFGVGVFMPFGVHLELSGRPETGITNICILPYCIIITLCSVSVLVTVAIAVDRLTSLAQPLRYKNIITHSSVEKYIAVFWIYAIAVGSTPLIYAQAMGIIQSHSGSCRFGAAVQPPVRVFLVVAVWAPSALILLGCYIYVYLVARAHARAIYTVELSFRHETQTLTLPRYGQTLAVTVGAFFVLWLPFQTCMLLDIFCGTKILTDWSVFWLSLPILAHSGLNPWIYAFHHGEMRIAAGKIAENLLILFGIHPSRYGCSPMRRSINFQLSDINKNNDDEQRPPVEDCFAAKSSNNSNYYTVQKKQLNIEVDISPEDNEKKNSKNFSSVSAVIEEDVNDLAKMLDKDYVNNRNRIIDKNYNIEKFKNLKYLLDPTFNKIRHLRYLNSNNNINIINNNTTCCKNHRRIDETKFKSYQNLKSELVNNKKKINAISEPMLNNTEIQYDDEDDDDDDDDDDDVSINELLNDRIMRLKQRRDSGLSSLSDPNIKSINNTIIKLKYDHTTNYHGHSIQNLDKNIIHNCQLKNKNDIIFKCRKASRKLTITANKLTNLFNNERQNYHGIKNNTKNIETIVGIDKLTYVSKKKNYLESNKKCNLLTLPRIRSEPPTPVDPLPLDCLEEESSADEDDDDNDDNTLNKIDINCRNNASTSRRNSSKCSVRYSDPIVPYVLLNIENFDDDDDDDSDNNDKSKVNPIELSNALLKSSDADRKLNGNLFNEHDLAATTRFSSRRPSDLRWFESSRSQEALSNIDSHKLSPSSYSVNNYTCTSGSDLNDTTFTDSFICPDPLTSSLRESFFDGQTDNFTSFDDTDTNDDDDDNNNLDKSKIQSSVSSVNFNDLKYNSHSKSTGSVIFGCRNAILKINENHRDCVNIRISDSYCNKYKNNILSPVSNEIFDGTGGPSGVRV